MCFFAIFNLGMIGDLHDHHQGLLPEPVLLLTDVISKRRISQYGYHFKGLEKRNTMLCEIDHLSALTPSSWFYMTNIEDSSFNLSSCSLMWILRHISQYGYHFKGLEKRNTMLCEIDHISDPTTSSWSWFLILSYCYKCKKRVLFIMDSSHYRYHFKGF